MWEPLPWEPPEHYNALCVPVETPPDLMARYEKRVTRARLLRLALATAALLGCVAAGLAWWVGR